MKNLNIFLGTCLIILTSIFIQSCTKSNYNDNPPGGGNASDTVTIQATVFSPATITVGLGTIVTWKNMDTASHTVTSDDGGSFNSGSISTNGTYTFIFTNYGSYPYHCSLHPGMTGTVQVVSR